VSVRQESREQCCSCNLGGIALTGSPSDFGKFIVEETEKWGKVVKFVGIKAD
jgi:hypothetical protein